MFEFTITPDGADGFPLKARWRDVVFWEKTHKGRSLGELMREMQAVWLDELAYTAATRQGCYPGTFEDWQASVDLEFKPPEEEPDPTPPDRSTGP